MTKIVGLIRRNFRNDWDLSSRAFLTIYGGLFVAHAAYGALVWYKRNMPVVGRHKALTF